MRRYQCSVCGVLGHNARTCTFEEEPDEEDLTRAHGAILYEGPSLIDGSPIVAVVAKVGSARTSNRKLGKNTAQIYILDQRWAPHVGRANGTSRSICGGCAIEDMCYVNLRFVARVWDCWERGGYTYDLEWAAEQIRKRKLISRVATFGDPSALPSDTMDWFVDETLPTIGYTHHWKAPWTDDLLKHQVMASVESVEDARAAQEAGWRTYRVRDHGAPLLDNEIACPADDQHWGSKLATCDECGLCDGTWEDDKRKNISIIAHGRSVRSLAV